MDPENETDQDALQIHQADLTPQATLFGGKKTTQPLYHAGNALA